MCPLNILGFEVKKFDLMNGNPAITESTEFVLLLPWSLLVLFAIFRVDSEGELYKVVLTDLKRLYKEAGKFKM